MGCGGRIHDPKAVDQELIAESLASGRDAVVVQFSRRSSYDAALLRDLNAACERFGAQLQVRFFMHGWKVFDCSVLRELPAVRSLQIDSVFDVADLQALEELRFLEEFGFGAFEAKVPRLLEMRPLQGLKKLTLIAQKKSNTDLRPLRGFAKLEALFLNKHAKNIDVLTGDAKIHTLGLSQIGRNVDVSFVQTMSALKWLRVILGGRDGVRDLANRGLEELEVLRVQGLEQIELAGFPRLRRLMVEDQLKVEEIDLGPAKELEKLQIINCKGLKRLKGMKSLSKLRYVWIGQTKLDADELIASFPAGVETVSLFGYGTRRGAEIKKRLDDAGYVPVGGTRAES